MIKRKQIPRRSIFTAILKSSQFSLISTSLSKFVRSILLFLKINILYKRNAILKQKHGDTIKLNFYLQTQFAVSAHFKVFFSFHICQVRTF